jgi:DNA-binding GntR family transcriptional regulator
MHEAVCVAIEQGDPDAAERAVLTLIEQAEADLREQLPERPSAAASARRPAHA